MEVDWFDIVTQHDGSQYVIQIHDEQDKNHSPNDTTPTNEAKMYGIQGKLTHS